MKTIRFSRIVDAAGRPRAHTLWVAPDRDPEFKRARAAHRVMTIAHTAGKTDAGVVGFDPDQGASEFLIFPKSLEKFEGARVVGVKFDLVEHPKLGAVQVGAWRGPPTKRRPTGKTAKGGKVVPFLPPPEAPPESKAKPAPTRAAKTRPPPAAKAARAAKHLVHEIRVALQELEAGKAVAAYRRLEKAIADA